MLILLYSLDLEEEKGEVCLTVHVSGAPETWILAFVGKLCSSSSFQSRHMLAKNVRNSGWSYPSSETAGPEKTDTNFRYSVKSAHSCGSLVCAHWFRVTSVVDPKTPNSTVMVAVQASRLFSRISRRARFITCRIVFGIRQDAPR